MLVLRINSIVWIIRGLPLEPAGNFGFMHSRLASSVLILLLCIGNVIAQENDHSVPITPSDPQWEIIQNKLDLLLDNDNNSPVGNKLDKAKRLHYQTLDTIFPGWKFYLIRYSTYKKDGFEDAEVSIAYNLGFTLAISPDANKTIELGHYGNFEAYGKLLKEAEIVLKDEDDAKLIWEAFCFIHQKWWLNHEVKKVTDSLWHLGISYQEQTVSITEKGKTIRKRTSYFRVETDSSNGIVKHGKLTGDAGEFETVPHN